jgi:hypothetical protein
MSLLTDAMNLIHSASQSLGLDKPVFNDNPRPILPSLSLWDGIYYNKKGELYNVQILGPHHASRKYVHELQMKCEVFLPDDTSIDEHVKTAINQIHASIPAGSAVPWESMQKTLERTRSDEQVDLTSDTDDLTVQVDFLGVATLLNSLPNPLTAIQEVVRQAGEDELISQLKNSPLGFKGAKEWLGQQKYGLVFVIDPTIHNQPQHRYSMSHGGSVIVETAGGVKGQ